MSTTSTAAGTMRSVSIRRRIRSRRSSGTATLASLASVVLKG